MRTSQSQLIIVRDEKRIARLRQVAFLAMFLGLGGLIAGFILLFITPNATTVAIYQLVSLAVGWLLAQIGTYLAHRYVRKPRPDQVLDEAIQKVVKNGRFYHYLLPAPHVLLTPAGIIVIIAKYQRGTISVDGDKWTQKGLGFSRLFGQEGLGDPSREAERVIGALANYIRKNAPEVEEVPIAPLIVFTSKGAQLDLKRSRIPAMDASKVGGFLKNQSQKTSQFMPPATYAALQAAFDKPSKYLLENEYHEEALA